MANGRAGRAVREVKRQLRDVRIADDSPLLSWSFRFAAQVMNKKLRIKEGKTIEFRRTG